MPVIRIAEIPNAGPQAVGASGANISVPQFGGMQVNAQAAQLTGAAALSDASIRRGAQSMLSQTLEQDAFTAEAEAGMKLGQSIGQIGQVAQNVAEKFGKAKDTADLARAETIMRAAFEKQQNEQLDLPVDKWEENWTRNLDQTRKALSEIKISNNAAAELTPSWERWSDLSSLQIKTLTRKKQIEGFQMDVDANAAMRVSMDDLTGAFAIYDRAERDGIFSPEENNFRKSRLYDDQVRKAQADNYSRVVADMNADPDTMLPLFERRSRGEEVPELGDISPVQATTLASNTQTVLRGRMGDMDDAADQAILTGEIRTPEELRKQFPTLPERRLLVHEKTMSEVFNASPEAWAMVTAARPRIMGAIETYDPAQDDRDMTNYFALKDQINREMPPGERAEFLEQLGSKRRDGNKLPQSMKDGLATLDKLESSGFFGKADPKKLESNREDVRAAEGRKLIDIGNQRQAIHDELMRWSKENPTKARDREKVIEQLRIMVDPSAVDAATEAAKEVMRPTSKAPAAVRNNNPGAMWYTGASWQKAYGAEFGERLNDGLGQGNQIARFPDPVSGAAAQMHLLSNYGNRSVGDAIYRWSGGNNVNSYLARLKQHGFQPSQKVSDIMADPQSAIRFAQAMARHEAGNSFPLNEDQWQAAFQKFQTVKQG
jgi:hypothetical protein